MQLQPARPWQQIQRFAKDGQLNILGHGGTCHDHFGTEEFLEFRQGGLAGICAWPLLGRFAFRLQDRGDCRRLGNAAGVLDEQQAQSVIRVGGAIGRSFEDITPEQEYYIGRTVGP
jgi:hypothetical protein